MSKKFDDTNRGSIWKNDKRREGKQDPDFTGSLNVDGHDYWVSAWKRKDGASEKAPALSFAVKRKDGKSQQASTTTTQPRKPLRNDMDDEIPF